jgi:flagellar biogenesis protein FliO
MKTTDDKPKHFFNRAKYYLVLILIIIIILIWHFTKLHFLEKSTEKKNLEN